MDEIKNQTHIMAYNGMQSKDSCDTKALYVGDRMIQDRVLNGYLLTQEQLPSRNAMGRLMQPSDIGPLKSTVMLDIITPAHLCSGPGHLYQSFTCVV